MNEELKGPKKGAHIRLREFYNNVVRKPLTEKEKTELRDFFKNGFTFKRTRSQILTVSGTLLLIPTLSSWDTWLLLYDKLRED